MNRERAKAIEDCILAMCPYCRASAETGMTTEHRCVAKPLWRMWDETLKESDPDEMGEPVCNSR